MPLAAHNSGIEEYTYEVLFARVGDDCEALFWLKQCGSRIRLEISRIRISDGSVVALGLSVTLCTFLGFADWMW